MVINVSSSSNGGESLLETHSGVIQSYSSSTKDIREIINSTFLQNIGFSGELDGTYLMTMRLECDHEFTDSYKICRGYSIYLTQNNSNQFHELYGPSMGALATTSMSSSMSYQRYENQQLYMFTCYNQTCDITVHFDEILPNDERVRYIITKISDYCAGNNYN